MSRTFLITRSYDLFDRIDHIADSRVKQAVALRLAGLAGSVAAYTALGLAATMAARLREANGIDKFNEALALMDEDEQRGWAMEQVGADYIDRATKIKLMNRLKDKFDQMVRASGWREYRGRTLEEELSRTTDPRAVRDQDVEAIVEHFDGEFAAGDVKAMLRQDAANEAARNAERIDAARIVLEDVLASIGQVPAGLNAEDAEKWLEEEGRRELLHFGDIPEQIRIQLLTGTRAAVMKLEVDLLQGRARGMTAIEKLAALSEAKNFRKEVSEAVTKLQQGTDLMAA